MTVENPIGISTITLARSPAEEENILSSLKALSSIKTPVVVVDGGSSLSFVEKLKAIPGIVLTPQPEGGLFFQTRQSLKKIAEMNYPFVFYTESNKLNFFRSGLREFLDRANKLIASDPATGVVVASRTSESLNTFPSFQRFEETITNQLLRQFLRQEKEVDYAYGPRIINTSLLPYLGTVSDDLGWGWMSFAVIFAKRLGKNIYGVPLNLPCPPEETKETEKERIYRLKQLSDHVRAIHLGLITPL